MEFARWVLAPGKWVQGQVASFWTRYLYFVGIRQQNDQLLQELAAAKGELSRLRENASEVERLHRLLSMTPPGDWTRQGARVISHRLGPNAALETFLIDKGSASGVTTNTPVVSPEGVVGRVLRYSPSAATVLLITDPNSRIPVLSQANRTQGILKGEGPGHELILEYVPQGTPIEEGEILVTSGLEEIFPKGVPVARVTSVGRYGASLFQLIHAAPLFDPLRLEEVALLFRASAANQPGSVAADKAARYPKSPAAIAPAARPGDAPQPSAVPQTPAAAARQEGVAPAPAPQAVKAAPADGQKHEAAPADRGERKKRRKSPRHTGQ